MELFIAKFLPIVNSYAASNGTLSSIVKWVAGIGGGIVAIFLIVSLVKDGIGLAKGSGDSSILKIIAKALFLILIIGLIFLAQNYDSLGEKANGIAGKTINTVGDEVNTAW